MRSRFAIASLPKTRVRAFGLALIALSSCALAPRAEAHWRKPHLPGEIASASAFTQIVEERVGGAVAKSYVFGPQRISMRDAGGLHYYAHDAHSGVRVLTDASGAVTDRYEYDAFGNLLARTGTTANDFMYRGELMDGALGGQYLRARWMKPGSGRFLTRDAAPSQSFDPRSFHRYTYTYASPTNNIDPSGQTTLGELTVAVGLDLALYSSYLGVMAYNGKKLKGAFLDAAGFHFQQQTRQLFEVFSEDLTQQGVQIDIAEDVPVQSQDGGPNSEVDFVLRVSNLRSTEGAIYTIEESISIPTGTSSVARKVRQFKNLQDAGHQRIFFFAFRESDGARERFVDAMRLGGVDPERVEIVVGLDQFAERYQQIFSLFY